MAVANRRSRFVEPEEIGESSADIDADDASRRSCARLPREAPRGRDIDLAVGYQHDAIVSSRRIARDIAEPDVARDARGIASSGSPQPPPPGVSNLTR